MTMTKELRISIINEGYMSDSDHNPYSEGSEEYLLWKMGHESGVNGDLPVSSDYLNDR